MRKSTSVIFFPNTIFPLPLLPPINSISADLSLHLKNCIICDKIHTCCKTVSSINFSRPEYKFLSNDRYEEIPLNFLFSNFNNKKSYNLMLEFLSIVIFSPRSRLGVNSYFSQFTSNVGFFAISSNFTNCLTHISVLLSVNSSIALYAPI